MDLNRAYAILHVKAFDPILRTIGGIATTPEPDRRGDVVEPGGVTFNNPVPLLLHHDRTKPVGVATFTRGASGINFEATLPAIDTPGVVKDRVDEAWDSLKAGLLWGASIGFRVIGDGVKALKTGGLHFSKIEIVELSLVTVPANAHTTIAYIKSLDQAATGQHPPRVTGLPTVRAHKDAPTMATIAEQIKAFETTRTTKETRIAELMTAAADTGVTLDAAQTEEYDGLVAEVKAIDAHLVRLADLDKTNAARATRVPPTPAPNAPARPVITVKSELPKGTAFTRWAMSLAACRGVRADMLDYAKQWKDSTPEVELFIKAAVAPGTTTDATWAGPLVPALTNLTNEFLELLRPATVIGKIPGMRRVPFNVKVPSQTGGGVYGWVGEAKAKPVTSLTFGAVTLGMSKIAGIIVLTEELVRVSSPSAEDTVRADMIAGIAQFMDSQFLDPAVAAVVGVNPASITNGTTAIPSSGATATNALTDIKALVNTFVAANLGLGSAVLIMSETNAFALATAMNALGQPAFPTMNAGGGSIMGIPVVTSSIAGTNVVLVDARGILYADDGGVTLDVSREASLQMNTTPDTPPVDATVYTSLWQNNLVGLRAERFVNWTRARLASVKYVSGAAYI